MKAGADLKNVQWEAQFQTGEVVFIILERVNGEIHTGELFACLWDIQGTRAVIYVAFPEGLKLVKFYILLQLSHV